MTACLIVNEINPNEDCEACEGEACEERGLKCPGCGTLISSPPPGRRIVRYTRAFKDLLRRSRECPKCGLHVPTEERVVLRPPGE